MARQVGDRLIDQIGGQVIAASEGTRRVDVAVVAYQFRGVLVGLGIHESVEAVEAAAQWPAVERPCCAGLGQWRDMPLAQHVVAVTVFTQHLGDGAGFPSDLATISGKSAVEVGQAAHAHGMMVASRQQGRAGGRAHGCCVKTCVGQALGSEPVDCRRLDCRAIAAEVRETDIVVKHDQDVGRPFGRCRFLWPPALGILNGFTDLALVGAVR